ncbi:MAG: phosphatidylcholine synthase [Anaerolineae bacterium]|nr:phosphatidylcholine synthase [Anaerolineae bacterium]
MTSDFSITWHHRILAWLAHLFTASGAVFGLLALDALHRQKWGLAFWLMGFAIIVDSADGVLARLVRVKTVLPHIDGSLLDNLLDYLNYVMVPAFFLLLSDLLPANWRLVGAGVIVLVSAFQFSQTEAKTDDHFFKGFPSYWNIVVFYLFLWQLPPPANLAIILLLAVLVFVPIKYAYPSRPDYLARSRWLRGAFVLATILWGIAAAALLWFHPATSRFWVIYSIGYFVFYVLLSIYRTLVPLEKE